MYQLATCTVCELTSTRTGDTVACFDAENALTCFQADAMVAEGLPAVVDVSCATKAFYVQVLPDLLITVCRHALIFQTDQ